MSNAPLPDWTEHVLRCPLTGERLQLRDDRLVKSDGTKIAQIEQGIVRFAVCAADQSINFYRDADGAHFHERAAVPFAEVPA
jgi:hypothetical protein